MNTDKYRLYKLLFPLCTLFFVLFLTACGADDSAQKGSKTPARTYTITEQWDNWQFNWLKGIPCSTPCWQGIMPGKTGAQEAYNMLRQSPQVQAVSEERESWSWKSGEYGGRLEFSYKTFQPIVKSIQPEFYTDYRYADLINIFGEPTHATGIATANNTGTIVYSYTLVFMNKGLALQSNTQTRPSTERLFFRSITFFVPGKDGFKEAFADNRQPELLVPWQGDKGFEFYCRGAYGTKENCPLGTG
jgi:hypothetical protein